MKNLKHLSITLMKCLTITIYLTSCSKDDDPVINRSTLTYTINGASDGTAPAALTQKKGSTVLLETSNQHIYKLKIFSRICVST